MTLLKLGRYAEAELLLDRSLRSLEKSAGPNSPDLILVLQNLSQTLELSNGSTQQAAATAERAFKIAEATYGPDHPSLAGPLNSLGVRDIKNRKREEAEQHLTRARRLAEARSPESEEVATILSNLAVVARSKGHWEDATELLRQADSILRKVLGEGHPKAAWNLHALGLLHAQQEQRGDAAKAMQASRQIIHSYLQTVLPFLGEISRRDFIRTQDQAHFHQALALGLHGSENSALAVASAEWLLNGKGGEAAAEAQRAAAFRNERDPAASALRIQVLELRQRAAELSLTRTTGERALDRVEALQRLQREEAELVRRLLAAGGSNLAAEKWMTVEEVRKSLRPKSRLIEITKFMDYEFNDATTSPLEPRYAAWIIPPAGVGEVEIVDLGPAIEIEPLISTALKSLQSAGPTIRELGDAEAAKRLDVELRRVAEKVWAPLQSRMQGAEDLILSPDGPLWLLPWCALPAAADGDERLIERFAIRFVLSGRRLALRSAEETKYPAALVANPDFDLSAAGKRAAIQAVFKQLPAGDATKPVAGPPFQAAPLPNTAVEAAAAKQQLDATDPEHPANLYQAGYALEAVVKRWYRPRIAVFATHGFFLPEPAPRKADWYFSESPSLAAMRDKSAENPLLRCGLLLAGCNRADSTIGDDDGVLTGLEICSIDFRGT